MTGGLLIPLDGSEMAESILPRLRSLMTSDVPVTLLWVVDPLQAGPLAHVSDTVSRRMDELVTTCKTYLDTVAKGLVETGAAVRSKVEVGKAAALILAVADEEDSSVICLSTHGRTGVERWVYGSVTEKVLRASQRPVLVVPSFNHMEGRGTVDRRNWAFQSLVVALDGSSQALQVIPRVADLARIFGSTVTLVSVVGESADAESTTLAKEHLERAVVLFANIGVVAGSKLLSGYAAAELLDYTHRHDHDMIAMTTHGRSGLSRWMLGSVAEKVLRRAAVPVLVVRTTEDGKTMTAP
jgi:nucleotide-binding universal stress UspA family protein